MDLHIISPKKNERFSINWIEVNSSVGNMVIQENHAPLLLILKENSPLTFSLSSGESYSMNIIKGVLLVKQTHITLLVHEE